ncbi:MAG TPA: hypothetical protein VF942_13420 [Acidimicrobiales bacterium]
MRSRRHRELIPFDLRPARNQGSFELTADLARHDGILYYGTAVEAIYATPPGGHAVRAGVEARTALT